MLHLMYYLMYYLTATGILHSDAMQCIHAAQHSHATRHSLTTFEPAPHIMLCILHWFLQACSCKAAETLHTALQPCIQAAAHVNYTCWALQASSQTRAQTGQTPTPI
jgi:hypothetical protein